MSDEVLWTVADGVATITLNRGDKRNAMNAALLSALRDCVDALDGRADVRVVVVRGAGPAFCAGMDLREMEARQGAPVDGDTALIPVLQRVERCRHPTIAMVHGDALAGGLELALHCDLRVAADVARFGMPLARLGLIVPFPLGQKIVEIVGPAHARQLLLTGRPLDARRAHAIGMVHEVVPAAELERVTGDLARTLAENAPLSLAGMKLVIHRALGPREGIAHGDLDALARQARQSADASEGRRAMLEKRKPLFRGE
jgi:enoyl-CoA hydratase/carnithine racemase